jgi:probable DNA metabolism protein
VRAATFAPTFDGWRGAARGLLAERVPPDAVVWEPDGAAQTSLLGTEQHDDAPAVGAARRVPRRFLVLAHAVVCHRSPARWSALYRVLWRTVHGEESLLDVATDPDVHRLHEMERAVRRAAHKMKAFVRFRAIDGGDGAPPTYVAWFEPTHLVVERTAPFFARRFASMRWSILTPDRCAHWDGDALAFTPGVDRSAAPRDDDLEALWGTYYANVFNPARLALGAMRAEMPKRYWSNLPEAALVPHLAREAPGRVAAMLAQVRAPAEALPDDLRRVEARRVDASRAAVATVPESWDAVHDPGVATAQARDAAIARDASAGLVIDGCRVVHGVAGWTDPTLLAAGVFYPDSATTPELRLRHYASRFPMVEVDATYYAPPTRAMAAAWAARTPAAFVVDVKAYALMTGHAADVKRMPDWLRRALPASLRTAARVYGRDVPAELQDELWRRFLEALGPLRDAGKLGAVFLQFPRWFEPSRESARWLRAARERLGDVVGAIEFRNPTWVEGRAGVRTLGLLRELELAYTIVDAPPGTRSSMPPLVAVTSPKLVVVRLHGRRVATWEARNDPVSERYRYLYDGAELAAWVPRVREAIRVARSGGAFPAVHLAFNNNHANYGAVNAREMASLLVEDGALAIGRG